MLKFLCVCFGKSASPVLILPEMLVIGNYRDPANQDIGQDSKTVYINGIYNLDTIPFDASKIIDTNELVDTD
jgi:hypothetical protein